MFKRIQSVEEKLSKRQKRGDAADEGPRELVLDEDSDSDSSSSEAGSSSSASLSEKKEQNGRVNGSKRAKNEDDDEADSSEDEDSESDDDDDSDDSDDDDEDKDKEQGKSVPPPLDPLLRPSIDKALGEPIYVKPDAIEKQGFRHRSCYFCPAALLKTEKMVETHLASGSHGRRLKRTMKMLEKLSDEEKRDPTKGGMDVVTLVERVDGVVKRKQDNQAKHQALVKQQKKEKKHRRMALKKERRSKVKAEKEEKKKRLREQYEEQLANPGMFPKKLKLSKDGKSVREVGQPKVIAKRHRVMPTKEERKAHRKVKKAERASRKANERRAKRAAAEATAAAQA